jgi:carbamoyltransferase
MTHRWTIGVNHSHHESAACIMRDNEVVYATAEERLSRIKQDSSFPEQAILAAVRHAGIELGEVTAIGLSWSKPSLAARHDLRNVLRGGVKVSRWNVGGPLLRWSEARGAKGTEGRVRSLWSDRQPLVHAAGHHRAHAWSAALMNDASRSAVIVADGRGSRNSTSIWMKDGQRLTLVDRKLFPDSLGLFYARVTQYLGFVPLADEWKVMGLAPFGHAGFDLSSIVRVGEDDFRVDGRALLGRRHDDLSVLEDLCGPRRLAGDKIEDRHRDVAFAAQTAVEAAVAALCRRAVSLTGCRNVAMAGGVALNCKANGLVMREGLVDDLTVQPAAGDDGSALGAAIAAFHVSGGSGLPGPFVNMGFGHAERQEDIEAALRTFKVRYFVTDDPARAAAERLASSQVVGWFQGRAEFGPRALGSRSILADPRRTSTRDLVNEAVKFRETWRPFAPSVLEERVGEYFKGCVRAPHMIITFDATEAALEHMPAIVHVDGTARVQTVSSAANPLYARLIEVFGSLTGVPGVLNTSFNLKGEPIVNTVNDAVRTFFSSGLDSLVIGNCCVDKMAQGK